MTGGQVVGLFQVDFDSVKVPTSPQPALESDNSHLKFCNSNFHSARRQVCDFYIHLRNSNERFPVSSLYIARLGRKQEEDDAFKNEQRVRNGIKRKKAKIKQPSELIDLPRILHYFLQLRRRIGIICFLRLFLLSRNLDFAIYDEFFDSYPTAQLERSEPSRTHNWDGVFTRRTIRRSTWF